MKKILITNDIKGLYSKKRITDIYQAVAENGDFIGFITTYMHNDDEQVVRNALSAMTKATDLELQQLKPAMNELIELAMKTKSSSVRRPLLGIIERLEMEKEDLRSDFLDYCLDKMMDINEVPSIQALCMKLTYKMCKFYPELMQELRRTLEGMEISYYTPAVKSVRRKILNQKRQKRNSPLPMQ